jgi:hypothetical protein
MLILRINNDIYKLHSDPKRQMKLRRELLSRYKDSDIVQVLDGTYELDRMQLSELFDTSTDSGIKFTTPIERIRNAGLTLPGKLKRDER